MAPNLRDKKVLVVGLARTGIAVASFLKNQGAQVTVADIMTEDQLGPYAQQAIAMGITLELGPHKDETFCRFDLVVLSPGVPHTIGPLERARKAKIPVIGELELAARYIEEPIIAISGTNGKTTTTTLVGEMLKASDLKVFVGGNIGYPLIDYVNSGGNADVIVVEISSFQLDTMESFRPKVGVLLNVTEDHLDRYSGFKGYVESKARLFENQQDTDVAILNRADPVTGNLEPAIRAQRLFFNVNSDASDGIEIRKDRMICRIAGRDPVEFGLANFKVKGVHNLENAAAASLAALAAGAKVSGIQSGLDTFKGLPHRLEHVKTVSGVQYFNDSKATNVGAVIRSVQSFDSPVILIMGGRDKGGSYDGLVELTGKRVKKLIAIGEASEKILTVLGSVTDSDGAKDLVEAVHLAQQAAVSGDVVVLSPACSSFDMFNDYAQRGEVFCRAVEGL